MDSECTVAIGGNTMPIDGTTIDAKWNAVEYELKLDANADGAKYSDDSTILTLQLPYKELLSSAMNLADYEEPTRAGYEFAGWYMDSECTVAIGVNTMPIDGTTIYAKWNALEYEDRQSVDYVSAVPRCDSTSCNVTFPHKDLLHYTSNFADR